MTADPGGSRPVLYSRACGHALAAAERLAAARHAVPGRAVPLPELARDVGISTTALAPLLRRLGAAGIVRARRGPAGGVMLARPAAAITVLDVVRAIDGAPLAGRCVLGFSDCADETPCPAHPVWRRARPLLERQLARRSLADLASAVGRKRVRARRREAETARGFTLRR